MKLISQYLNWRDSHAKTEITQSMSFPRYVCAYPNYLGIAALLMCKVWIDGKGESY